jgi:hypothetical protein
LEDLQRFEDFDIKRLPTPAQVAHNLVG